LRVPRDKEKETSVTLQSIYSFKLKLLLLKAVSFLSPTKCWVIITVFLNRHDKHDIIPAEELQPASQFHVRWPWWSQW